MVDGNELGASDLITFSAVLGRTESSKKGRVLGTIVETRLGVAGWQ